jgi:hypothetical protein
MWLCMTQVCRRPLWHLPEPQEGRLQLLRRRRLACLVLWELAWADAVALLVRGPLLLGGPLGPRPKLVPAGGALDQPLAEYDAGELFQLPAHSPTLRGKYWGLIDGQPASFISSRGGESGGVLALPGGPLGFRPPRGAASAAGRRREEFLHPWSRTWKSSSHTVAATPLAGPPTVSWLLDSVATQGRDLLTRHHRWVAETGVKPGTAAVFEHQILSIFLQYGATVDRFIIKNLTAFELAARRMQLHERAVSESPEGPSCEGARHFLGIQERRG